jgi:hypothetical protein
MYDNCQIHPICGFYNWATKDKTTLVYASQGHALESCHRPIHRSAIVMLVQNMSALPDKGGQGCYNPIGRVSDYTAVCLPERDILLPGESVVNIRDIVGGRVNIVALC